MDKKDLIFKLISLKVNDASFKENEEEIINNLRELYRKNKDSFSKEDIKIIKIIDDIKELSEDIQYCRSKESIEQENKANEIAEVYSRNGAFNLFQKTNENKSN